MIDLFKEMSNKSDKILYINRYLSFIENCSIKNKELEDIFFESHHILPKSLYPEYSNFSSNDWNKSLLTPRQHFIAHIILAKIFGGKMVQALMFMCNLLSEEKTIINSRIYSQFRNELIEYLRISNSGVNNPMYGRKHSDSTLKKLSEIAKKRLNNPMQDKNHTVETKLLISIKAKERYSDEEYLQKFIEMRKTLIKENPHLMQNLWESYKVYLTENTHPRLGKLHTLETKEKISNSLKNYYNNPDIIEKISGQNNPMFGRMHSDASKEKMSISTKKWFESLSKEEKEKIIRKRLETRKEKSSDDEWFYNSYLKYRTDEYKSKMSNSVKNAKSKLTEEEKIEINKKRSESAKLRYSNMTKEEKENLHRRQKEGRRKNRTNNNQ